MTSRRLQRTRSLPPASAPRSRTVRGAGLLPTAASNAALGLLLRQEVPDAGTPPPTPTAAPTLDPASQAFVDHGIFGPQNVIPGGARTGAGDQASGGFEATYDPAAGQLAVKVRAAAFFVDAIDTSGGAPAPADPKMQRLITNMPPPGPDRVTYLALYQWSAAEKTPWLDNLKTTIHGAWSGKHEFHCGKAGFEWIGAKVDVTVETHEAATRNARNADDHLYIETVHLPTNENLYSYRLSSSTGEGTKGSATDQTMLLAMGDVGARPDNMLKYSFFFAKGSFALSAADVTRLDKIATSFSGADPTTTPSSQPASVDIQGFASSSGDSDFNMKLSEKRTDTVKERLRTKNFRNIDARTVQTSFGSSSAAPTDEASDQRVDVVFDGGSSQVLAAHEFGHAFGLGDEYAVDPGGNVTGTGQATGSRAIHDKEAKGMQSDSGAALDGAINENNANIMSGGNRILPQHYSTFHEALKTLTSVDEWFLGPVHPKPPPAPGTTPTDAGVPGGAPVPAGVP